MAKKKKKNTDITNPQQVLQLISSWRYSLAWAQQAAKDGFYDLTVDKTIKAMLDFEDRNKNHRRA